MYYSRYDIRVRTIHQYSFKLGSALWRPGALVLGNPIYSLGLILHHKIYRLSMLVERAHLA